MTKTNDINIYLGRIARVQTNINDEVHEILGTDRVRWMMECIEWPVTINTNTIRSQVRDCIYEE